MASSTIPKIAGVAVAGGAAAVATYLLIIRPWHTRWGATDEEVSRPLPSDEIVERPILDATRAVTIGAPPEEAWLVQMGYRRVRWYVLSGI